MLLRLDPAVHEALSAWAAQDLRSVNAHIEWLLRRALGEAGRMPRDATAPARRGRPQASRVTSTETNSSEPADPA
jgi:hypothetical protein